MPFYHVIAKVKSESNPRVLFADLSETDLSKRFLAAYRRGRSFFSGNDLVSPGDILSLQIIRTARPDQVEREALNRSDRAKIDEGNRSSTHVVVLALGRGHSPLDIVHTGEDVTHTFVKGPPGYKAFGFSRKAAAWVLTIIGAVIAAGVAKWLGWV